MGALQGVGHIISIASAAPYTTHDLCTHLVPASSYKRKKKEKKKSECVCIDLKMKATWSLLQSGTNLVIHPGLESITITITKLLMCNVQL